ncbi:hypothetical protein [Marinomonas sp. CT5]|nr:hypothetical protein [Marinomonas sp. CT5]
MIRLLDFVFSLLERGEDDSQVLLVICSIGLFDVNYDIVGF